MQRLGVPYISYRDLVWPEYTRPPKGMPFYWNGLSHPDWVGHTLLGKSVASMMFSVRQLWCSLSLRQPVIALAPRPSNSSIAPVIALAPRPSQQQTMALLDSLDTCALNVGTILEAQLGLRHFQAYGHEGSAAVGIWQFRADSRDKLGWIGEVHADVPGASATIEFLLLFGSQGKVIVSYLQSYADIMGKVQWWLVTRSNSTIATGFLNSFDKAPYSITVSAALPARGVPQSSAILRFQLHVEGGHASKFKLLGIAAC